MMILTEKELPREIVDFYPRNKDCNGGSTSIIYRATKKGTSTIIVRTIHKTKDVWKKHGKKWRILDK